MSDNNPHHPGVRSLLAKFEGQSPVASPPPRGRSPTASDSSGTVRRLSKVRASFINVNGVIQSNPASPLRKTSGRSGSPGIFGPKINSGDAESGRQVVISPTPLSRLDHTQHATLGQTIAEGRPEEAIGTKSEQNNPAKEEPTARTENELRSYNTLPKQTDESTATDSKSTISDAPSQKSDSSVIIKKKSSSVESARNAASKAVPTTAASTDAKPVAHNSSSKPMAREVVKERANSLSQKPSRVSLNPKITARSTRGPALAQGTSKPRAASVSSKSGMKSPPRPVRVPGSANASTHAPAAKLGSTGGPSTRTTTSASTLTRKPSTLKSATGAQPRATTPTTSSRRQSSRPSPPAQAAHDISTKPVNEGFLARMMRPTASSANKSHPQEKTDITPITRTNSVSKATRSSIGRVPDRGPHQVKSKGTALRPQSQKSQPLSNEPAPQKDGHRPSQKKEESVKEKMVEHITASSMEAVTVEHPEAAATPVEEPGLEIANASAKPTERSVEVPEPIAEETVAESYSDSVPVENSTEVSAESIDFKEVQASAEAVVDAHVKSLIEPIAEDAEEEKAAETSTATEETVPEPAANPAADDQVEVGETQKTLVPESEVLEKEDDGPATEANLSNVGIDITNLAQN
ncbi:hypothetical protein PDIG_61230 [Penicillium digitatum PHI26]|uniref:Mucin-7 n=3 Tax=Penicillium digitatum TaxID=36651 RepID=K9G3U4_PEND2|nr:hypothetical protein PDIP_70660 [Penicillium digitatum Pd1]EKV07890.1 hypothetical protein PDIP_70660 [Penicillium digitatum Pd1]EKV09513.1 hypothetical protein PDIG_61230 [Penicillium digitatum PHI26]